ncbi:DNA damage-regulated autophagy modulator protein 1-like [Argiope bruennichi]|uniref:DNA damage-regulated autophagy modulator like protein n=1 Tax=Argiope bruennichi TaxID=94029 RepID=A0A8T0FFG5_ARGBR|nr:DNA damage-regulated autophagy modulator protein 1-like [Argiope bruennichi]XP_055929319.1 DNA damage-regulated autophagy modulator protein 1-like [Argiope bruennichi]XP_055929320.1 DNA damage-regulated autophagy modulator protein 1-like [Argiope bruennichi]KAF8790047.1 DNA damage-regulated autophagy modulator like protein [Argiope bruennichi]
MSRHSCTKLTRIFIIFGIVYGLAIFLPFIISLSNGRVTPYVPYISEGGGQFPEAGIFCTLMVITAFTSQVIIFLRYLVVEGLSSQVSRRPEMYNFLNAVALVLGSMASFFMIVMASYPTTALAQVHNSAAGMVSICFMLYMICHTWISTLLSDIPSIPKWRLFIVISSSIALVMIAAFGIVGSIHWKDNKYVGIKEPEDQGFAFYVVSASAEWIWVTLIFLYFITFIHEFKKSTFHFYLEISSKSQSRIPRITITSA